jgi:hypothetical protein
MVQIDIPAAFVVSMLSLDLGRRVIQKEAHKIDVGKPAVYYRFLCRSVFFAGFVIAPAGIYLLAGWPGWEQIYWSKRFEELIHTGWANALLPAFFVMAIVLAAYVGHILAYRWLVSGKEKYIRPTYILVLIMVGVIVLSCYPSFLLMGTYDQYHNVNSQTREMMTSVWKNPYDFSRAWIGVMIYFASALVCLIFLIRKECQQIDDS